MRILLTENSRKKLFEYLKKVHKVKSLKELGKELGIPFRTLEKWKYGKRYMPLKIVPATIKKLKIIDKKEDF